MGVYDEVSRCNSGMHWQQHERYMGPAYDPSRDLSPNLPVNSSESSCSPMGDVDPSFSNSLCSAPSSTCSTPSSSNGGNNNSCGVTGSGCPVPPCSSQHPPCNNNCRQENLYSRGFDPSHRGFPDCDPFPPHQMSTKLEPQLKREPQDVGEQRTPSPTPPMDDSPVVCAGCGRKISDRFYLLAVDRRWHASCLKCCQCRQALEGEVTCFSRDGNIYCKKDYYRLFGMKRCSRCQAAILSSELVMRARELVFHVHCFSCAVCQTVLSKGDHFGMRDGAVLCRLHYEMSSYPRQYPSPEFNPPASGRSECTAKGSFFNGTTGSGRQKGRPRKRKPKDLESMTANLDLNAEYLDVPFGRGPGTPGMTGPNSQRTKRMRTSFKHHQLRTMKSYFAINHNPDAKDLKQLSQKTGLPKRVLQVWFQNARAKWRRMVLKTEGKSPGPGDKPESGGSLGEVVDSFRTEFQPISSRSPSYILGSSSPPPLECS